MYENEITCASIQRAIGDDSMLKLTSAENDHVASCHACTELLVTRLLQRTPEVVTPAEFPARVRSRLTTENWMETAHRAAPAYGFVLAVTLLIILALAWSIFVYFDPQWWIRSGRLPLVLECVASFEIGAIALWLGTKRSSA